MTWDCPKSKDLSSPLQNEVNKFQSSELYHWQDQELLETLQAMGILQEFIKWPHELKTSKTWRLPVFSKKFRGKPYPRLTQFGSIWSFAQPFIKVYGSSGDLTRWNESNLLPFCFILDSPPCTFFGPTSSNYHIWETNLQKNPPEKKTCHHSLAKGKYPIIPLSLVNRVVFQPGYVYLNRIVSNHFFPYQVDCTSPMDETNHQDLGEVVEDAAGPTDWLVKMRLGKKNTTSEIHICLLKSYIVKRNW